jgi:multiple sugar transport system substrate-binding protein
MREVIRVLLIGGPMYDPLYERLRLFEGAQGVSVEVAETLPHPELNERIEKEFSVGTADYDLISTHTKYAPSQAQWLTALDEDFAAEELAGFSERTLELSRIRGRLFGIPRNQDLKLLYYRTDLIERPPESWEELAATAARLSSDGRYGFAFPGRESGLFGHFFELHAMAGGRMFDHDGAPAPRLDDDAGRWALSLLQDLYRRAAPPGTEEWHYDEVAACFRDGRAAMSTDWPGGFYTYQDPSLSTVAGRHGVALYPEGRAGRFIYSSSHTVAIPSTVRDRPAAVSLLKFLTSEESQASEAALGTLPARDDALERVRTEASPGSLEERRWALLEQARSCALTHPKHHNYPSVENAIWRGIQWALIDQETPDEALPDIESAAREAALDGAGG